MHILHNSDINVIVDAPEFIMESGNPASDAGLGWLVLPPAQGHVYGIPGTCAHGAQVAHYAGMDMHTTENTTLPAKEETVCRCSFCQRGYTLREFLKNPLPPSAYLVGKDYTDLGDGIICIVRDCACQPEGHRTSLAAIILGDGTPLSENAQLL